MKFRRSGLSVILSILAMVPASAARGQDAQEALLPVSSRIVVRTIEAIASGNADENRDYAATLIQDVRVNGVVVGKKSEPHKAAA